MTVGFPMSCLIPMFTHECNLIRTVENILAKTTLIKINNCILCSAPIVIVFYSV